MKAEPPPDLNKNTSWFQYPGVWTTYISIIFFGWLVVLSLFGCSPGSAWSIVHLIHFAVRATDLSLRAFQYVISKSPLIFSLNAHMIYLDESFPESQLRFLAFSEIAVMHCTSVLKCHQNFV